MWLIYLTTAQHLSKTCINTETVLIIYFQLDPQEWELFIGNVTRSPPVISNCFKLIETKFEYIHPVWNMYLGGFNPEKLTVKLKPHTRVPNLYSVYHHIMCSFIINFIMPFEFRIFYFL